MIALPNAANDTEATISKEVGRSSINYKIVGELEPVLSAIGKLFGKYDPRGYGTACHLIVMKDGKFEAHLSRSTNCD